MLAVQLFISLVIFLLYSVSIYCIYIQIRVSKLQVDTDVEFQTNSNFSTHLKNYSANIFK